MKDVPNKKQGSLPHMFWNKRRLKVISAMFFMTGLFLLAGCNSNAQADGESQNSAEPIKIAFYPNESASEFEQSRNEIQTIVSEATGRDVEIVISTDYNIVIESIANGQVDLAYMGPDGYIEANRKNENVQAILTNSGASGTLEDAVYYSFIVVNEEDTAEYQEGDGYTLEPIEGKTFSFVSNSSTSGFRVPSQAIVDQFGLGSSDELIIDGDFFNKVLFGGSHQGSAVNLLKGDADLAAFMNMAQYFDVVEGEENKAGVVYQVKADAEAPFDTVRGEKVRVIHSIPVLNGPFVVNRDNLDEETVDKITQAMMSEEVTNNEAIFSPKDSESVGLYQKEADEQFVEVTDSFYDPLR